MQKNKFHTIDEAIEDNAKGKMVILVDDEDRTAVGVTAGAVDLGAVGRHLARDHRRPSESATTLR